MHSLCSSVGVANAKIALGGKVEGTGMFLLEMGQGERKEGKFFR